MGQSQNKPLRRQCLTAAESTEFRPCAVCIGLGGGSLPLFLAHHFPGMLVQAVELDPVVLAAASQAMGFPLDRCLATTTHRQTVLDAQTQCMCMLPVQTQQELIPLQPWSGHVAPCPVCTPCACLICAGRVWKCMRLTAWHISAAG